MRAFIFCMALALTTQGHAGDMVDYRPIPGGQFVSALSLDGARLPITVASFSLRAKPVSSGEYLDFVSTHPEWQRKRVPALYASQNYLASWAGPLTLGTDIDPQRPVTEVSWFTARAFCASENARLPTWYEWEYAAAADTGRADARDDPARNAQILQTLLGSTCHVPGAVGQKPANFYGVHDLNTLVWEWVEDYAAMFVNADARDPGQANLLKLCGGSALAFENRSAYPLMMRIAALSAMQPTDVSDNIGFRCVRDATPGDTS